MIAAGAISERAAELLERFLDAGAERFETDTLMDAGTLLDLYGEDIRARAYLTGDAVRGELALRPDFTVPLLQAHLADPTPARYAYAGRVYRKQDSDPERAFEFIQVGYEVLGAENAADAEADVFATIRDALDAPQLTAVTGDIGVLRAAIGGLRTSAARKAALMRHLWRPERFKALLDRFGGRTPVPATRTALLAQDDPWANAPPLAGERTRAEIEARIVAVREDAATPPISSEEIALLTTILSLDAPAPQALGRLRDICVDMPALEPVLSRMTARLDALVARDVAVEGVAFKGKYGRTSLEYYDGFVFGFSKDDQDLTTIATGGRYDALTARLGGHAIPAVGGVIRPDLLLAATEDAGC